MFIQILAVKLKERLLFKDFALHGIVTSVGLL
jgi:hypothetical protein